MNLCSDTEMAKLVSQLQGNLTDDLAAVERLLTHFPEDPRLHFMLGSVLAEKRQPLEAHAALARAVELAPEFHLARYQLGFFELTSGEVDAALSTWAPLQRLPGDTYIRMFVDGLIHLVRDEFDDALALLREGVGLNRDNEPLNNDVRLLITECETLRSRMAEAGELGDQSATSLVLGWPTRTLTRH